MTPPVHQTPVASLAVTTRIFRRGDLPRIGPQWNGYANGKGYAGYFHRVEWAEVLHRALGHEPYFLAAFRGEEITGLLPLTLVRSALFGRFLVSLPYLNSAGVLSDCDESKRLLLDQAIRLADELRVRHLELRQECEIEHPGLTEKMTSKVHLRLSLPGDAEALLAGFKSKLRSQVKKALSNGQTVDWGNEELLGDFYAVFSRNMRDLGTPVFPRELFRSMLRSFPAESEMCVVRQDGRPVAAALLLHGPGTTLVPSASTLREFNATNANMRLYWHLMERTVRRGQACFDFGRSSTESGTFKFKEQWGAQPHPAVWQYYRRTGQAADMRPENSKFKKAIMLWQKLPLGLANVLGPWVVRGIP